MMTTGSPITIITPKTPLPSLSNLSRNALLYGLASGCVIVIPENSFLGEEFWENLVQEASNRKLLSDAFFNGLVESGIWLHKLMISSKDMTGFSQGWWKTCVNAKKLLQHLLCFTFLRKSSSYLDFLWKEELSSLLYQMSRNNSTLQRFELNWNGDANNIRASAATSVASNMGYSDNSSNQSSATNLLSKSIQALLLSTSSTLQVLKLEGIPFINVFSSGILEEVNWTCLHTLSFANSTGFRDRHGRALLSQSRLPNLRHLDISFTSIHNLTYTTLCHYRQPLLSLNLSGTTIDMSFLRNILTSFSPFLLNLHVQCCPRLSDGSDLWYILTSDNLNLQLQSLSMELWFSSQKLLQPITPLTNPNDINHHQDQDHDDVLAFLNDNCIDPVEDWVWSDENAIWVCPYCTLMNQCNSFRCAACYGKRPSSSPTNNSSFLPIYWNGINDIKYNAFPKLPFPQLQRLSVIIHVDEDSERMQLEEELDRWRYTCDDESSYHIGIVAQSNSSCRPRSLIDGASGLVTTLFVQDLLSGLPTSTITDLSISSVTSTVCIPLHVNNGSNLKDNIPSADAKQFTLGLVDVSTMVEKMGTTLQKLELHSVRFSDADSVYSLLLGLRKLQELTLIGTGCMQPPIPQILNAVSSSIPHGMDQQQPSKAYYRCDSSGRCCPNLEKLTLVVQSYNRSFSNNNYSPANRTGMGNRKGGEQNDSGTVADTLLSAPSLEKLWIQGCSSVERLLLDTPSLGWMHISDCHLLSHISFHDSCSGANMLQHLQVTENPALNPLSIASLRLPFLKRLDINSVHTLQDWQLNRLIESSRFCLTGARFQCRGLGNQLTFFADGPFHPNILQIYRPSSSLDLASLTNLFIQASRTLGNLRDLLVHRATGLKGIFSAACHIGEPARRQSSRLGAGATDGDELMGQRHIERIIQEALRGGNTRYQFPPTLNSFQRRLVHETAEDMGLWHESVSLGRGVKVVEVRTRSHEAVSQVSEEVEISGDIDNTRQRTVVFHLNDSSSSSDEGEDSDAVESQFEIELEQTLSGVENMNIVEQAPAALSRRAARLAGKRKGNCSTVVSEPSPLDISASTTAENSDTSGSGAMNDILQCEITGYVDSKLLRRLIVSARQLPIDSTTCKSVCIKYLRGVCPFQNSITGGNCNYAHIDIKASKLKKFSQLIDFVCGRDSEALAGNRSGTGASKRVLSGGFSRPIADLSDCNARNDGRRCLRRHSRSSSLGSETDDLDDESLLTSRSPSSPNAFPSSPRTLDNGTQFFPPRLDLASLLRLELTNCEGLTGASISGKFLCHVSFEGCRNISFLDLWAPELQSLQMSGCVSLKAIPLYRDSFRRLRAAIFTNCRELKNDFMSKFVDHCRSLCQLHIFGCGILEKGSGSSKARQKGKTKAVKWTASRPNLEIFTMKKECRMSRITGEETRFEDRV